MNLRDIGIGDGGQNITQPSEYIDLFWIAIMPVPVKIPKLGMAMTEGGGMIIGEGCHWLDLMCWMLEERPVRITAVGSTRMNYVVTVELHEGSLGCLAFGVGGSFEWPKELFELQHRGKIFRSECFVENHYFGLGERTIKKFPLQFDFQPAAGTEGGLSGYLTKIDAMLAAAGTDKSKILTATIYLSDLNLRP